MTQAWRSSGFTTFVPTWAQVAPQSAPNAGPRVQPKGVADGSPPSSYAVVDVLDGRQGSILRLIGLTMLRGVFIVPGLWVAAKLTRVDLELRDLLALSFAGSATISVGMLGYYWIVRRMS